MTPKTDSARKCYGQSCTVTTALDVAGDRWTLLILRELLGGPARFEELVDGLPGIARNLLSSRLRRLESDGLLRRVETQGVSLHVLTELGAGVRPVLEELGFWGLRLPRVGPADHDRSIRSVAMALQAILARAGAWLPEGRCVVELDVDGEFVEIVLSPEPTATVRIANDADLRLSVSAETMAKVVVGHPFSDDAFHPISGELAAKTTLVQALRAPFGA